MFAPSLSIGTNAPMRVDGLMRELLLAMRNSVLGETSPFAPPQASLPGIRRQLGIGREDVALHTADRRILRDEGVIAKLGIQNLPIEDVSMKTQTD